MTACRSFTSARHSNEHLAASGAREHGGGLDRAAARYGIETITGSPVRHDGETAAVTPDGGIAAAGPTITIDIDPARLQASRNSNPTARHLRF